MPTLRPVIHSLRVRASTIRRVLRVAGLVAAWLIPSASTVFAAVMVGLRWFGDIATQSYVADEVGKLKVSLQAVQDAAFATEQRARDAQLAWAEIVSLRAELEVWRRYPNVDTKRRGDLVDDAQGFYVRYYEAELRAGQPPHEAVARAFKLNRWRAAN